MFKIYYDTLDNLRFQLLGQEYEYRSKMESFEKNVKKLVSYLKNFSLIEFYHEEKSINKQMKDLTGKLDNFEGYLPKTKLMATEIETVKNKIKVEVRDRIKGLIKDVDHSFAIKNYQEILNKINENKSIVIVIIIFVIYTCIK